MRAMFGKVEVKIIRASQFFAIVDHPEYALPIRVEMNSLVVMG